MLRVFVRELGGHSRLQPRICGFSRSVSTLAQDVGVKKGGWGGLAGFGAVLAGVSIVASSYYQMTREPQPSPLPPVNLPTHVPAPAPFAPQHVPAPAPFAPPAVSARNELLQRVESLKSELEALRKQKRDNLIDMKKKAIKEDIQIIQSSLASLDKQS